jgi:restriction system protein
MTQRTFEFRPPQWRPPAQLNVRTGALLLGTAAWLALYAWLGLRLLAQSAPRLGWVELALVIACVVMGVWVVMGWRRVFAAWLRRLRPTQWPALSRAELYRLTPSQFEEYVAQRLFARQGYAVENTPDVRDGGVDILVTDGGGRRAVVQCKRYQGTVGESVVRDLYGTMLHHDAAMGYLVTTGAISDAARQWSAGKPLHLIDGQELERLSRAEPARQPD